MICLQVRQKKPSPHYINTYTYTHFCLNHWPFYVQPWLWLFVNLKIHSMFELTKTILTKKAQQNAYAVQITMWSKRSTIPDKIFGAK